MFAKAVIDSGPLFSALILNYYELDIKFGRPINIPGLKDPLRDQSAQGLFLELLSSIKEKLTTSHVIGELQGLEKSRLKLYGDGRTNFWRASIDLLTQWNVDEKLVRLLDLASDDSLRSCLPRIGHVDTGLIDLALRHGCVLITEDEPTLASEAWRAGVDCRLVKQLISPSF
jgi:rRNA-processing protein FCF1